MKKVLALVAVVAVTQMAWGQSPGLAFVGPKKPVAGPPLPVPPASEEVVKLLTMLHDRKDTLKDFTAKIDYSVFHPQSDETSGKRGTASFLIDPNKGPIFTVDFTVNTDDAGKAIRIYHSQFIFDGEDLTLKDFGGKDKNGNDTVKEFTRQKMLPAGAVPGSAVALNGPLTLPIGLEVKDVLANFDATIVPAAASASDVANTTLLRLVPRPGTKFDYKQLDVTVDSTRQLPVKLVQTETNKDVTTISLTEIVINSGNARMADPKAPAGWTERKEK